MCWSQDRLTCLCIWGRTRARLWAAGRSVTGRHSLISVENISSFTLAVWTLLPGSSGLRFRWVLFHKTQNEAVKACLWWAMKWDVLMAVRIDVVSHCCVGVCFSRTSPQKCSLTREWSLWLSRLIISRVRIGARSSWSLYSRSFQTGLSRPHGSAHITCTDTDTHCVHWSTVPRYKIILHPLTVLDIPCFVFLPLIILFL